MAYTGIILAGGKSSRMGQDKGWIKFQGKELVRYGVELLEQLCDEIIISANSPSYQRLGYPVVADEVKDCGPVGGLYSCLRKASGEWSLVISCDVPFVTPHVYLKLLENRLDRQAAIPVHGNKVEPLIGVYHASMIEYFGKAIETGQYKLQDLLTPERVSYVDFKQELLSDPYLFHNLNRLSDFDFRK